MFRPILVILHIGLSGPFLTTASDARCCMPDIWDGVLVETGGTYNHNKDLAKVYESNIMMSSDATNKRQAWTETVNVQPSGATTKLKIIKDFKEMLQYTITDGKCTIAKLATPFPGMCIPGKSSHLGNSVVGGRIATDIWWWSDVAGQKNTSVRVSATTTAIDVCVPLTEVITTVALPVTTLTFLSYYNVTLGNRDPSVYLPPKYCPPPSQYQYSSKAESRLVSAMTSFFRDN
ncbi:unnamed protein product [Owenia fusiformis]|uniref:Uncharacterized protein n=1 Tax=Owenia fusiformis TaxID=6347 RepID=A0A8J1UP68_OWEFU|nr:unnamed protein product [Owenia fusiformis]